MSTTRSNGPRKAAATFDGAVKAKTKTKSRAKTKTSVKSKAKVKTKAALKASSKATSKSTSKAKTPAKKSTHESRSGAGRKSPPLLQLVCKALEDMKAVDIRVLDVRGLSDVTDYMVIAGGTSDRHLRSVADRVVQMCKAAGQRPLGVEGEQQGEWVLVDLPDVMVHIMLPRTRELYQLEQLWDAGSITSRG